MALGIAILDSFNLILGAVCAVSVLGFGLVVYNQFILPIFIRKESDRLLPVATGDTFDLVVDELSRFASFSIGCKTGNLATRCQAITEDHLIFQFKKSRDSEDYNISVLRNGISLFKPPRMDHYSKMDSKESFESYEIIGHPAEFRISDKIVKDRMVNYIEISLTASFYFNKLGKERMRFQFRIGKIQPGINRFQRFRGDVYAWGKEGDDEE